MSAVKTSFLTGAAVAASALTIVIGSVVRQRVDSGAPVGLFAARENRSTIDFIVSRDQEVPEGDFFKEMVRLLRREYVEPIRDEQKLAIGAVRGMVMSLGDPDSLYYDAEEFRVFLRSLEGQYEGIGAEFVLDMDPNSKVDASTLQSEDVEDTGGGALPIPRLRVVAVTPGGPANKAGVLPGDIVDTVDGKWVPGPDLLLKYRTLSNNVRPETLEKLPPEEAKRRQEQFRSFSKELWERRKHMLMPQRAKDRLSTGTEGTLNVVWRRGNANRTTAIPKGASSMRPFQATNGRIVLPFRSGISHDLKRAIAGRTQVTIDLRNNVRGDFAAMREALAVLAPSGAYGLIDAQKAENDRKFIVSAGNAKPPKITLLVDRTTRGPAEIFALALSSKGLAKLSGGPMGGERTVTEVIPLPDGSGYTLAIGEFRPSASNSPKPAKKAVSRLKRGELTVARLSSREELA